VTKVQGGPDRFTREEVQATLGRSALAGLPDRLRAQLLAESVRAELPRGRLLEGPPLFLVVSGLIRVALQSPDGRRFAVAYLRRGDIAGLARLTGRRYPLSFETVTDCRLLRLGEPAVQELLRRYPEVGVAVASQLNLWVPRTSSASSDDHLVLPNETYLARPTSGISAGVVAGASAGV
jgi:hypothetical protein